MFKSLKHPEEFVNKIDSLILIHEDKHLEMSKVKVFEENAWNAFALEHHKIYFAKSCIEFVHLQKFWSISSCYPHLVSWLSQIRLMGNFGFNASIPWAKTTDSTIYFICKEGEGAL